MCSAGSKRTPIYQVREEVPDSIKGKQAETPPTSFPPVWSRPRTAPRRLCPGPERSRHVSGPPPWCQTVGPPESETEGQAPAGRKQEPAGATFISPVWKRDTGGRSQLPKCLKIELKATDLVPSSVVGLR